jgi:hypothetical protein
LADALSRLCLRGEAVDVLYLLKSGSLGMTARAGPVSTLVRAGPVGGARASARRRERADLLLPRAREHIGVLDWRDWRRAVDAGYRHALEVLEHAAR